MRNIILGTDFGTDCDDAAAIRILVRAHKNREVNLLGIIINDSMECSCSALKTFLKYEGVSGIPIGIDYDFDDYKGKYTYQYMLNEKSDEHLSNSDFEDGVNLYRRLLLESRKKVDIIEIGFTQVLSKLLNIDSKLIKDKVNRLWVMGGKWDNLESGREFNFSATPLASKSANHICKKWPTRITFLGWEIANEIICGKQLADNDILRDVFQVHGSQNGRSSWDPLLTYIAVVGDEQKAGFDCVFGRAEIEENGINHFTEEVNGSHCFVIKKYDNDYYEKVLENLIT